MPKNREITRELILDAAANRIQQYGFNKTTMNEIAKDCNMSAANIYRFFDSKNDIAAEMAQQSFVEVEKTCKDIARKTRLAPVEKLKAFCNVKLRTNYEMLYENPNCFEIIHFIMEERDDLISAHKEKVRSYLAEILAEGNRTGLFDIDDVVTMADTFQKAVILFYCPVFIKMYTLEEMEASVECVVNLLVAGLKKR